MRRLVVLGAALAVAAALGGWALASTLSLPLFSPPRQIVEFGYVTSVTPTGKSYQLKLDAALWLEGRTANVAAAEDGVVKPGEPVPNDYYIRNPDHKLLTYKLPAGTHVTILVNLQTTKVTVAKLAQLLVTKPKSCGTPYQLHPPVPARLLAALLDRHRQVARPAIPALKRAGRPGGRPAGGVSAVTSSG